ncbi:MAG: polyprenyl synthetase family protein [Candidatus Cryptobacteroides sp.]
MDIAGVREYLGEDWIRVQTLISTALESGIDLLDSTNRSLLSHSGKQLRPLLSLLVAKTCLKSSGGSGQLQEVSFRYAAAAELLHNATLLHDDVADESDLRRGTPTVRSLLGAQASVLVGDFWLVRAVRLILGDDDGKCDPRVVRIFSDTLSSLAEGEMLQLQKSVSADTDYQDYLRIIYCKTASLFEASALTAAISTAASVELEEAARHYAASLGYAFQIRDDILDYCGTSSVGKPLGVDLKEQKITLPLLGAIANRPESEMRIRETIKELPEHPDNCAGMIDFVRENGGIGYATDRLNSFVEDALKALDVFTDGREKELLEELALFPATRTW